MKEKVEQLLEEKIKYLTNLIDIVSEQKTLIEKKCWDELNNIDNKKMELINKILEIDKFLEMQNFTNKIYFSINQDLIKNINVILNKLILVEKENIKMLSELNSQITGYHIEYYQKIKKQIF